MKTSNRIISLVLAIFISLGSYAFASTQTDTPFEPGEHPEIIAFLKSLGLVDDDFVSQASSRVVTRGEFAKVVSSVMLFGASTSFDTIFADVPREHIYAPYIYAVRSAGYMNGTSQTAFSPDEPILYEQAVSVCVKLAGYEPVADTMGYYPESYLTQASKLGLLEKVSSGIGIPLSRGNLVELIYNTVLCDMMILTGYGDTASYAIYEGVNILSHYHKIYEDTGVVSADNHYSMTSEHSGYADAVIINGQRFYKKDLSVLNNSVGRQIKFWYVENGSTKTILHAIKHETNEIVFGANDGVQLDFKNSLYRFYDKDKTLVYRLSDSYDVIYNMEELYPVTESRLMPRTGTVTLIDNNDDSIYDVVIIDEFYNLVADMYNKNLNVITDIADLSKNINLDDIDSYRVFDKSGSEISLEKIRPYSIIEIYKSASGKRITAVVSSDIVSGKYAEKTNDKIIVNGGEYKISSDVRGDISSLTLGNEYEFYINSKNEIVYWTLGGGYKQGYILELGETTGLDRQVAVKLLSQNGKVEVYNLADKVKNITYGSSVAYDKSDYSSIFTGTNSREFVLYQLNDKKEVIAIVHAMSVPDHDTFSNLPSYPLFRLDHFAANWDKMNGYTDRENGIEILRFKKGINGFDNMLIFSADAKLYKVPAVTNLTVNERNMSVSSITSTLVTDYFVKFTNNYQGEEGTMMTYIVGDSYPYANVMVEHGTGAAASVARDQESVTVTSIKNVYDKETMESSIILEVWDGQGLVNVTVNDESQLLWENFHNTTIEGKTLNPVSANASLKPKIEIGDIIKYTTDESGTLGALALMYDARNKNLWYNTEGFGDQYYNLANGTVSKIRNNFIEVEMPDIYEQKRYEIMNVSALPTLIVDLEKNKTYVGSSLDIEVGDIVLRYSKSSSVRHLVIYKN